MILGELKEFQKEKILGKSYAEKFLHMTDFFSTGTACGACDKYQV